MSTRPSLDWGEPADGGAEVVTGDVKTRRGPAKPAPAVCGLGESMVSSKNSSWRHFEMKEKKRGNELKMKKIGRRKSQRQTDAIRSALSSASAGWTDGRVCTEKGDDVESLPVSEWHDVGWDGRMGGYFGAG